MGKELDGARYNDSGDLLASRLPDIKPDTDYRALASSLYRWTEDAAISTLDWYLTEKKSKARWSRALRVLSVLFIAAGGVAPLIVVGTGNTKYAVWGYPLLGVGAACIGLDRVFGFSSSWMRYLATATTLHKLILEYQLCWATIAATWTDTSPKNAKAFQSALAEIQNFSDKLSDAVVEETKDWIAEFRGHVSRLEAQANEL
jgi:hypothetical protein